jgi:hypothetical protein
MVPKSATEVTLFATDFTYDYCDYSKPVEVPYQLDVIEKSGVLGGNGCKTLNSRKLAPWAPIPGRLVVFARRDPWWERWWERLWGPC